MAIINFFCYEILDQRTLINHQQSRIFFGQKQIHQRGEEIMAQGVPGFKYEIEKEKGMGFYGAVRAAVISGVGENGGAGPETWMNWWARAGRHKAGETGKLGWR